MVAPSSALQRALRAGNIRVIVYLRRDADGPGAAHGILLSSRNHDRAAGQCAGRAADAIDDAGRRSGSLTGIFFAMARENSGPAHRNRSASHHWYWAKLGRTETG